MQVMPDTQIDQHANSTEPAPPLQFNFAAWLFGLNQQRADKTAYIDDTGQTTYGELESQASRFASALRFLGVHREERILLVMLDTVELPVAFLGALHAGVVPVVATTLLP
jgi:benzoate-CoA ligase